MFVNVQYLKLKTDSGMRVFGGREYTYETDFDLRVGDVVIVPAGDSDNEVAKVTEVNVARPTFQCKKVKGFEEI